MTEEKIFLINIRVSELEISSINNFWCGNNTRLSIVLGVEGGRGEEMPERYPEGFIQLYW